MKIEARIVPAYRDHVTVAGSDWSRRLRDTRAVYWTRFSSNQPSSFRAPPPPFFFSVGMQRNRPASNPRDERGGKEGGGGGQGGGVLRGEQAEREGGHWNTSTD